VKWTILFGGGLALFLYAMSQQATAQDSPTPDIQPSDTPDTGSQMPVAVNRDALVLALAVGIANGEGYFREGTIPRVRNNPGDIKVGGAIAAFRFDTQDQPVAGGGWSALFRQLNLILNGSSSYYNLNSTVHQMCQTWTADPEGSAQLAGYIQCVVSSLNDSGYPATEDTTLGALARGDFSG
jgi:hypothetical protein